MRTPKSNRPQEAAPLGPAAATPPEEGSFAEGLPEFIQFIGDELVKEYLELLKSAEPVDLPQQPQQQGEKK